MRTLMDYSAPAYQPWLTKSQLDKLDDAQNCCLQAVTGVYRTSNIECRRIEADVPSYHTRSKQLIAIAYEKGLRLPEGHPRRDAIDNSEVPHRLSRSSFREEGKKITQALSTSNAPRKPIPIEFPLPWENNCHDMVIYTNKKIKSDIPAIQELMESLQSGDLH